MIDEIDSDAGSEQSEQSQSYESDPKSSIPEPTEPLPPVPQKALICSLCLVGLGVLLLVFGGLEELSEVDPSKGFAFWVIGTLMLIPGIYYSVLL